MIAGAAGLRSTYLPVLNRCAEDEDSFHLRTHRGELLDPACVPLSFPGARWRPDIVGSTPPPQQVNRDGTRANCTNANDGCVESVMVNIKDQTRNTPEGHVTHLHLKVKLKLQVEQQ